MSRGRKPISNLNSSEWENVFYNSVGTYVQYINIRLSKEYKLEPLSNHLKIIGGYAFKTAEYKNQGIPIIRISDFNNEQIVLKDVVYYEEKNELDKYQLIEGDIIIALTGGTIAKLAIVQGGLGKIYLNQRVGKFQVLKSDEFEVEYIYWLARSIQSIIKNLAWGAAIPNVSPKQIEELKFPFPSKETQRGIIDFLNDLKNNNLKDDKIYFDEIIENEIIALQEKQLTTSFISTELTDQLTLVKKLRQQLLQDAVQGKLVEQNSTDEPASELLKKIKAYKKKLIAEKKLKKEKELPSIKDEEIPFEIPENWVWCRLGEIIQYTENLDIQKHHTLDTIINYIDIDSIDNQNQVIREVKQKTVGELSTRARRVLKKGYIMYSTVRPYLKNIAVIEMELENFIGSTGFNVFQTISVDTKYVFNFLLTPKLNDKYKEMMVGFNSPSITNEQFKQTLIPLPPLSEQNRIVQKLGELMKYCDDLEESIKESQLQNEKLLQQVLREALGQEQILTTKLKPIILEKTKKSTKYNSNTLLMEIQELLKIHGTLEALDLWKMSKFYNNSDSIQNIDGFYAELKKLIEIEKIVKETKKGYLELV